jgi:hypothetical protein
MHQYSTNNLNTHYRNQRVYPRQQNPALYHFQPYQQIQPYYHYPYPTAPFSLIQTNQGSSFPNPYPTNFAYPPPQQSGFNSILTQFKKQDGTYDINKMMDTAGQMMGAVNQVSGLVKGFSNVFKT